MNQSAITPAEPDPYPDSDPQVFYELARERLAIQLDSLDAVDNKIGLLFSTSTALLGILAAVLALKRNTLGSGDYVALGASVAVYVLISWQSERAYRCRSWSTGPILKDVWRRYKRAGEGKHPKIQWEIANQLRIDIENNRPAVNLKLDALQLILPSVIAQSLILVLTLGLVAAGA